MSIAVVDDLAAALGPAEDPVVAGAAEHPVVAGPGDDPVVLLLAVDEVVAGAAVDRVAAAAAAEDVRAREPLITSLSRPPLTRSLPSPPSIRSWPRRPMTLSWWRLAEPAVAAVVEALLRLGADRCLLGRGGGGQGGGQAGERRDSDAQASARAVHQSLYRWRAALRLNLRPPQRTTGATAGGVCEAAAVTRRSVLALALLAALALPAVAAAKPKQRWSDYSRPATFEVVRDANVAIPASDGVTLRANVDRPDQPGRYPTIVVQTPYNKDGVGQHRPRRRLRVPGRARLRGRHGRRPRHRRLRRRSGTASAPDEQRDGYEVVEWAAAQPWSTGDVGLAGPSYMGLNQLLTAAQRPPHLKAIFPIVPMADSYRDITFSGGQLNASFIPLWLGLVTAGSLTPSPVGRRSARRPHRAARPRRRARSTSRCRRSSAARPAATSPSTGRSGRRARRSRSSTGSTCRRSSSAATTTSSSAASRWSTSG